jgi:hypothetical protein
VARADARVIGSMGPVDAGVLLLAVRAVFSARIRRSPRKNMIENIHTITITTLSVLRGRGSWMDFFILRASNISPIPIIAKRNESKNVLGSV